MSLSMHILNELVDLILVNGENHQIHQNYHLYIIKWFSWFWETCVSEHEKL